jgi:hypothetical protein
LQIPEHPLHSQIADLLVALYFCFIKLFINNSIQTIMKKKVQKGMLWGAMLLSMVASAQAQVTKQKVKSYLDLMVNMANTNLNYGSSNYMLSDYKKSTNGLQAGISLQSGITSVFSLVTELYFIRKGGKLKDNNPLTTVPYNLRINTLELPVLARVHMGKFYLNAGPSVAYNLSGKSTAGDVSNKVSFGNTIDGFKRFEAGVQVGGGLAFPIKQKRIALDIRYNYGLTNISYNKEMFNRGLMVSILFSKALNKN